MLPLLTSPQSCKKINRCTIRLGSSVDFLKLKFLFFMFLAIIKNKNRPAVADRQVNIFKIFVLVCAYYFLVRITLLPNETKTIPPLFITFGEMPVPTYSDPSLRTPVKLNFIVLKSSVDAGATTANLTGSFVAYKS